MNPKDLVGAKKAPLALVPAALVIGASEAMQNGAEKYGPFNWREYPVQIMTYCEAIQRHMVAFVDGQDYAEDTGIHHLKHAAASLGILLDSIALGIAEDNRPPKGPAADLLRVLDKTAKSNEPLFLGRPAPGGHDPSAGCCAAKAHYEIEPWGAGDGPIIDTSRAPDCAEWCCARANSAPHEGVCRWCSRHVSALRKHA